MAEPFFTIGHSTRALTQFIDLLKGAAVDTIVDVRTIPRSRTNPQYNADTLPGALAAHAIGYEHIAALGGRRGKSAETSPEVNDFWRVQSFHNYADYALTQPFRSGLEQLRTLGKQRRCAIMCAEAVWWRCHRRLIADYLLVSGESVLHIMGEGRLEPAQLTPGAQRQADGSVTYPSIPAHGHPTAAR
ncbi:MAG: DUF488 family protein [Xanthobacteraceae bacterium]